MRFLAIFFTFIGIGVSGCSQSGSGRADQVQVKNEKEARKVLNGDQVVCQGDCPNYVGAFYLYYQKPNGEHWINLCSATLIGKNQILTNKHCIEDILKEGDLCDQSKNIVIKFPKTADAPYEEFKCKKILKTSKDYFIPGYNKIRRTQVPDWAMIEIDTSLSKSQRQPVTMAAGSLEDRLKVDLFPVYFDKTYTEAKGTIQYAQCTLTFNERGVFSGESDGPLFDMKNCQPKLVHGNSGTGVFVHGESELIGVMATGGDSTNSGTRAHCIPQFASNSDECIFPQDQKFTEIMKSYYYLTKHIKAGIKDLSQKNEQVFSLSSLESRDEFQKEDLKKIKITFESSWQNHLSYLSDVGGKNLKNKYELALTRILFVRSPQCVKMTGKEESLSVALGGMKNWNFLKNYEWSEEPRLDPDGGYIVGYKYNIPGYVLELRQYDFKPTVHDENVRLDLVKPIEGVVKSLSIELPRCH